MELQIETYELQNTEVPMTKKERADYEKMVDELGLEGMAKMLQKEGIIPFKRLDDTEREVWKNFCPGKYDLKEYGESIIPMRVLGLIKVAIDNDYFEKIEIWTESEKRDPIAIGKKEDARYLIARWGEALISWEEVVESAVKKLAAKMAGEAAESIGKLQVIINDPITVARKKLQSGRDTWFNLSVHY